MEEGAVQLEDMTELLSGETNNVPRRYSSETKDASYGCKLFLTISVAIIGSVLLAVFAILIVTAFETKPASISHTTSPSGNVVHTSKCKPTDPQQILLEHDKNREIKQTNEILLLHATIFTANEEQILRDHSIRLLKGKIVEISSNVLTPNQSTAITFDLNGAIVTPGIIDMHSHIGIFSGPEDAFGTVDDNEMTDPTTPQMRVIDAFDPEDPALQFSLQESGVTTLQILPGSGNVMGGEALHIKNLPHSTTEKMKIKGAPRALKMACGENPKRVYGELKGTMPMTRMGSAWLMRQKFESARKIIEQQDSWCLNNENVQPVTSSPSHSQEMDMHKKRHGDDHMDMGQSSSSPPVTSTSSTDEIFPFDLELDGIIGLLRGVVKLNVHCYQIHDLEMVMRLADEFNFSISAFHHGLEAYKITEPLKHRNITVATFSDLWGYKLEAFDASVNSPSILFQSGVPFAIKSDHPVTDSKDLIHEAAKAWHYGVPEQIVIQSVTSVPAKALGLDLKVGMIKEGLDADLVIWNQHPLKLGSKPVKVFIEGNIVYELNNFNFYSDFVDPSFEIQKQNGENFQCNQENNEIINNKFAVTGVNIMPMTNENNLNEIIKNQNIIVENGFITCIGTTSQCPINAQYTVYNFGVLQNNLVLPGLIESASTIGQLEIGAEQVTTDGQVDILSYDDDMLFDLNAIDGISLLSRHINATRKGGVLSAVVAPMGSNFITGNGVAFYTRGKIVDDSLIKDKIGLWITLGNDAKNKGFTSSVTGQFSLLRKFLNSGNSSLRDEGKENKFWNRILNKEIKLIAKVHSVSQISSLLRLKKIYGFDLVIVGGAESHLVAETLARENVPVILAPARCIPYEKWEWRWCAGYEGVKELINKGVKVGLAVSDDDNARNLRWEAGLIKERSGLTLGASVNMITRNIADIFGLQEGVGQVKNGTVANFVVYSGDDPLSLNSYIQLTVIDKYLECKPKQF